jgi:hypothetical protein
MEKSMKKKMSLLSLLLVPLLLLPFAFANQSSPPRAVIFAYGSGSIVTTDTQLGSPTTASGYTIIAYTSDHVDSGSSVGTCNGAEVVVVYPDNSFTFQGTCIFAGTIGGFPGHTSYTGTDVTTFTGAGSLTTGAYTGQYTVSAGTGGLAGIQGEGTLKGILAQTGTYSGWASLPA